MTVLDSVTMSQLGQQADDELVTMFTQALSLNPELQTKHFPPGAQLVVDHSELQTRPQSAPIYASAHYTHSTHVSQTSTAHTPMTDPTAAYIILTRHGVDPACLSTDQLGLFMNADTSQKMRLIQLWRISSAQETNGVWNSSQGLFLDVPGGSTSPDHRVFTTFHGAEPYMVQGYQQLASAKLQTEILQTQNADMTDSQPKTTYSPFGSAVGDSQDASQDSYRQSFDPAYRSTSRGYCFLADCDSMML